MEKKNLYNLPVDRVINPQNVYPSNGAPCISLWQFLRQEENKVNEDKIHGDFCIPILAQVSNLT